MKAVISQEQIKKRNMHRVVVALVVALFAAALLTLSQHATSSLQNQAAESLKNSIQNYANQCYAVEGAYPPSLDYLVERYGLVVNRDDYFVTYDAYAENIAPTVTVVPR